jgi:hypothetical protein
VKDAELLALSSLASLKHLTLDLEFGVVPAEIEVRFISIFFAYI